MLKRVDVAVFKVVEDASKGQYNGGTVVFGLGNQGVDYAMDEFNDKLVPKDLRKQLDDIKTQIVAGKIKVPDFYEQKSAKAQPKAK